MDSDFDASEEDEAVEEAERDDEPRRKRKQWLKPTRAAQVEHIYTVSNLYIYM